MSAISIRLPDSLHEQVRLLAEQDRISINQFITVAIAEKLSALMTESYLSQRAQRGNQARFATALGNIEDNPPDDYDRL